jgi:predicted AlkP superfamily pyrophosphatase or phosphodiesterase
MQDTSVSGMINTISYFQKNKRQKAKISLCFLFTLAIILFSTSRFDQANAQTQQDIKLILQITVDGLRGDLLNRYGKNFGEKGFKYLLNNGILYTNAQYLHANTETIVGHTTLATGTFPSEHGMVGNVWLDPETKELAYNIEDPDHPLIPTRQESASGDQVDPAQKLSRTKGRSPVSILAPTLSDTLAAFNGGRSKIFGVSGKDRGAVSMAGHGGKAFWFSTDTGDFITSTYYYEDYPKWLAKWNANRFAQGYAEESWSLLNEQPSYLLGGRDNREYEVDLKGFGKVFPHVFGNAQNSLLYTQILVSPLGDKLLLDFSKELLINEKLGQDEFSDYLSISFSSVDAVNHFFGPSSLENEDVILQLDRTLADLFEFIERKVGLNHTLIVFSADHGMADMPEYMEEMGLTARRLYPEDIMRAANEAGQNLFKIEEIVRFFYRPYLYLDDEKILAANLDQKAVENAIAKALTGQEGIALAVSSRGMSTLAPTPLLAQVQHNFHPSRSGDVYIVQKPYWFLFDKGPVAAMHGSPWQYDTHVPIVFMGPNMNAKKIHRLVHPVDVAPTIAALLGMTSPASARGNVLKEVIQREE